MNEMIDELFKSTHMLNENNFMERVRVVLKKCVFDLFYLLLKKNSTNLLIEIISLLFQFLQIISFPLNIKFRNVWKCESFYQDLSNIVKYFSIVYLFEDNTELFFIFFYLCVFFLIIISFVIVYVSIQSSKNKLTSRYPISFIRTSLHNLVTVLFLPIFFLFLSVFYCDDGKNVIIPSMECYKGTFYLHCVVGVIFAIYFIGIAAVVQCLFFDTKVSTNNPMGRVSSRIDVNFLIVKIIVVIIFCFFGNGSEGNQWILIMLMYFMCGFLLFTFIESQPFYRKIVNDFYLGIFILFTWVVTVLFICKILEKSSFNGGLMLLLMGIVIILVIIFTKNGIKIDDLINNITKGNNGHKCLMAINIFKELIEKRETDRNSKIVLDGYIQQIEEHCPLKDCSLKKYLQSLHESKIDAVVFLLQHCETMYQNAISKFPLCIDIRISYAFFLIEKMNKKNKAFTELKNAEKHYPSFEQQFIIYRYKKDIEEETNDESEKDDDIDFVTNLEYKNHFTHFKSSIVKASILYLDFWSLLLNPNQDSQEDLSKLNDYGAKINILVEEINSRFDKMQKLKHNDKEGLKYYADFLNDILNDKEKAKRLRKKINEIEETKVNSEEINIMNIDINALSSNSDYQYIVCSAHSKYLGTITNVSLGIYIMFGFTKNELVGKNIDILIPEIFHKEHSVIMTDLANDFKKTAISITDIKKFKPNFYSISTYGRNKSRYLVPLNLQNTIIPTENNDTVFIAKVAPIFLSLSNTSNPSCVVITNETLIIQNFTPSAMNLLGMSSGVMNSAVDITDYIKQFNEDFLKYVVDNEGLDPEQKLILKQTILLKKFKSPVLINWKINEFLELKHKLLKNNNEGTSDIDSFLSPKGRSYSKVNGFQDENFILTVEEATIRKKKVGYIFKFERLGRESNSFIGSSFYNKNVSTDKLQILKKTNIFKNPEDSPKKNISGKIAPLSSVQDGNDCQLSHTNVFQPANTLIEKSYVPESNFKFMLDPVSLSYKTTFLPNEEKLNDYLKHQALQKINAVQKTMKRKDESSDSESSSESNSDTSNQVSDEYSNSEQSQSSYQYSSSKDITIVSSEKNKNINVMVTPKSETRLKVNQNQYYKVDISKIKYIIFNYQKNAFLEVEKWDRKDQVEVQMTKDQKKDSNPEYHTEDINNTTNPGKTLSDLSNPNYEENENQQKALVNQIEYALQKQEAQPTITKMKWVSLIVFILLAASGFSLLFIMITSLEDLRENMRLAQYSLYLLFYNTYGAYYTRELTLLNNKNYTAIPYERDYYIEKCYNSTLQLFQLSHQYMTYILTSKLSISKESEAILNNSTIPASIIQDDLVSILQYNLPMTSAFVEVNTALFQVAHIAIDKLLPTHRDVFYFLYNSLNDVEINLSTQVSVYINEMNRYVKNSKIYYGGTLGGIVVIYIVIYFTMSNAYDGVAKRKESYLEVFFEIGNSVIKASLEKCENFTKKIQSESVSDFLSSNNGDDISEEGIQVEKQVVTKEKNRKLKKGNVSKNTRIFRLKLALCLFLILVFVSVLYAFFWLFIDKLKIFVLFYKNFVELDNEYMMLFNGLREFLFDPNGRIMNQKSSEYIEYVLANIYDVRKTKQDYITSHLKDIPGDFRKIYSRVYTESACSFRGEYFESDDECELFTENATQYGLGILITYFIVNVRQAKTRGITNERNRTENCPGCIFNLTLANTPQGEALWPLNETNQTLFKAYLDNMRVNNFNCDDIHKKLIIIFNNLVFPGYLDIINSLSDSIYNCFDQNKLFYILVMSLFIGFVVLCYVLLFVPFQVKLNQTIYKTKNMLSIIPKEVLASLSNIQQLLDIGLSNQQAKKIR